MQALLEKPQFEPGDKVTVLQGLLRDVQGIMQERRKARQLVIWMSAIGRGIAFTICWALVAPAK